MKPKTDIADMLRADEKIENYKRLYKEKSGKNAPPYCLWSGETIEEYRERLRKLVEEK